MRRLAFGVLGGTVGYAAGVALGLLLVNMVSTNTHDLGMEAIMTAALVVGPIGGLIGFVTGAVRGGRPPGSAQANHPDASAARPDQTP